MEEQQEKIDELVEAEIENQSLAIKGSDQFFIQQHYKYISLEQLCIATNLSPETISEYINEYETYLKSRGVNTDRKFQFNMGLDSNGNVSYSIEWPDINSIDSMLPYVGKFFYVLNKGELKGSMAQFLAKYADDRGAYKVVRTVMEQWNEQVNKENTIPLIEPQDVFGGD